MTEREAAVNFNAFRCTKQIYRFIIYCYERIKTMKHKLNTFSLFFILICFSFVSCTKTNDSENTNNDFFTTENSDDNKNIQTQTYSDGYLNLRNYENLPNNGNDDQIIYAMLMNQIQYSLQAIKYYKSKIILEQEYENIICKIDKSKLKDEKDEAINAYSNMLSTLTSCKLQENQRIFIIKQAEKEKSEAIYKSLNGTALPAIASLYQSGKGISKKDIGSILSGATSFVYTGISSLFNYRNAINTVDNTLRKELFEIDQEKLKIIDGQRNSLFKTCSKFITNYNIPKRYDIKEDQMLWLVETLDTADPETKLRLLKEKIDIFQAFTPFWYELGSAYQSLGDIVNAKKCYDVFEKQKAKYSIIDNDSYYTELAKNRIQIAKQENDLPAIKKYLRIIEQDETVANESENRFFAAGVHLSLGEYDEALHLLSLIIDDNKKLVTQARDLYEYIDTLKSTDINYKFTLMLGQLKISPIEEIEGIIQTSKKEKHISNINKKNLSLYLPKYCDDNYNLTILIDGKYYDAITMDYNGFIFYFINYPFEKFIKKQNDFNIIITGKSGEQINLQYGCKYYNSGDLKLITNSINLMNSEQDDFSLENTNIFQINLEDYINELKSLENNKTYKNAINKDKIYTLTEKYKQAQKLYLQKPYNFKSNLLIKPKKYVFNYALISISDKTNKYEFSKYGNLTVPQNIKETFTATLATTYESALLGDSNAEYDMGMAYLNGEGVEINHIEAFKWFMLSATKNNMKAIYQLGCCFENGIGIEKNKDKAMDYYQKAADLGHQASKQKIKK